MAYHCDVISSQDSWFGRLFLGDACEFEVISVLIFLLRNKAKTTTNKPNCKIVDLDVHVKTP